MLRITKDTEGVLDLSPIRDEHGVPVTLNGPSFKDVPDAERDNPILQRVVDMKWVTVTRLPVTGAKDAPEGLTTAGTQGALNSAAPSGENDAGDDKDLVPGLEGTNAGDDKDLVPGLEETNDNDATVTPASLTQAPAPRSSKRERAKNPGP